MGLLSVAALSVMIVSLLRWMPPPTSAFMLQWRISALFSKERKPPLACRWVGWDKISSHIPLAVIAAEDQRFPDHSGFDFDSISRALAQHKKGKRLRGASTITQQVAKNLFLWPGRSLFRKGLEACFTVLLETLWPKRRILEVYMNIVAFGAGVYGVAAACWRFLKKGPERLSLSQAALLAAVLPNPKRLRVDRPSAYVRSRAAWIERQMNQLRGSEKISLLLDK